MSRHWIALASLPAAIVLVATTAAARDIPLLNWTAPSTWPAATEGNARGSRTALAAGQPFPFIPVTPCRIVDTRGGAPFTGGAYAAAEGRDYQFSSAGAPCNVIPASAVAFSINLTVTGTAGPGFIATYPRGAPPSPLVSTLNYVGGQTIANAAVVPGDGSGFITIKAGVSGAHVIVDINGYYASALTSSQTFTIMTSSLYGIYGESTTGTGVFGSAAGTGKVFGVEGGITPAAGAGAAGVHGAGASTAGKSYGVFGENSALSSDSAAVLGTMTGGSAAVGLLAVAWFPSGVRGESGYAGVLGFGNIAGAYGLAYSTSGAQAGWGILGFNPLATTTYGVYGAAGNAGSTTNWAVYAFGDMGATGAKPFIEPHPRRADLIIRYVALEGPEAGTYFRGRGRFSGRSALIEVPESFRLVTDEEGMTVQVTPVGDLAQVAVVSIGLDVIELKSSQDVEFFFTVNGVRKTFKDWKVIVPGSDFMPYDPEAGMPGGLSAEQKRSLVRNGTYNEDGTVNMRTAERLGWDKIWAARKAGTPPAARENLSSSSRSRPR